LNGQRGIAPRRRVVRPSHEGDRSTTQSPTYIRPHTEPRGSGIKRRAAQRADVYPQPWRFFRFRPAFYGRRTIGSRFFRIGFLLLTHATFSLCRCALCFSRKGRDRQPYCPPSLDALICLAEVERSGLPTRLTITLVLELDVYVAFPRAPSH